MKFYATIEEVISQTFEIETENIYDAYEIAVEKYKIGEFVIDQGKLVAKQISLRNEECKDVIDWVEF